MTSEVSNTPHHYARPRLPEKWWEGPLFWPADIAEKIGGLFHYRFGTWRLYQWLAGFGFWVLEKVYPEGQQTHQNCPCTYSPENAPAIMSGDPDPSCDICFGSGTIWTDWQGNVISNTELFDEGGAA